MIIIILWCLGPHNQIVMRNTVTNLQGHPEWPHSRYDTIIFLWCESLPLGPTIFISHQPPSHLHTIRMFRVFLFASILSLASAQEQNLRGLSSDPKTIESKGCVAVPGVPMYSQDLDDKIIFDEFFANPPRCGGTVVEMGGLDGKMFSNSWFFQVRTNVVVPCSMRCNKI